MCQRCTAHFLHSGSQHEVVTSESLEVESGVACSPCVPHESVSACWLLQGLLLMGLAGTGLPRLLLQFALFQPLDVMAQLQRGPQFETHVFHDHVAPQQHQSFSINLLWKTNNRTRKNKTIKKANIKRTLQQTLAYVFSEQFSMWR